MMLRPGMVSGGAARTKYRYLRLGLDGTITASGYAGFYTVAFSPNGGSTLYPTSAMTSDTAPSPLVASANSQYGGANNAYAAFDGNNATRWTTAAGGWANAWVQIDLGAGNAIAPNYLLYRTVYSGGYDMSPTAITVWGSNDGTSFDQLLRKTGLTSQPDGTNVTWTW